MLKNNYNILGKRNPILRFENDQGKSFLVQTIGDPHLGRNYRNNLRHRLGDREEAIKQTFYEKLRSSVDITVVLGDLFDKVSITNEWFNFAIKALEDVSQEFPKKLFVILNGNHDLTKDRDRISSFELLVKYFSDRNLENLIFVDKSQKQIFIDDFNLTLFFTSYDPFSALDETLRQEDLSLKDNSFKIAFGHFEIESFGSDKFINRLIPNVLLNNFDLIVTGHIHKPITTLINDVPIIVTGSMQPYSFGEEIADDGDIYITLPLSELKEILERNPEAFIKSNVRILYTEGDELLSPFDCYSITYKHIPIEQKKTEVDSKSLDMISFSSMFLEALNNNKTEDNMSFIEKIEKVFLEKDYESN